MDKEDVKLKHKVQIRRKKPEKKGLIASTIDFIKANQLKVGIGILFLAGVAMTIIFLPKEPSEISSPSHLDTLTQVVDTPGVEKIDTITNVDNITSSNEDVIESTPSGIIRSGDVTVDAKKAIRGDFGNGAERRRQLGSDYEQVQALVNKMYREGNLHW